jgi:hypothetical protein
MKAESRSRKRSDQKGRKPQTPTPPNADIFG